jgi:hypothetical protein
MTRLEILQTRGKLLTPVRCEYYFFSNGWKEDRVSFLAFFAARFSFNDSTGFLKDSLVALRSFDMVALRFRDGWY